MAVAAPRLHESAKVTIDVLETVHDGQGQPGLPRGSCTEDDKHRIFEALRVSGYVTKGSAGWQPMFGGRL